MNNKMEAQKLSWGKGQGSYESFRKYSTNWNLQGLIEAAHNTEERVKKKLISSKNFPAELKGKSLGEIMALPKEVQYNIDKEKSIDMIEQEVINILIDSGYATQVAVNELISQTDYKDLKANIKNGDMYSTKSELVKGLQDLSLAKKLGFDKVNIAFQGSKRVDRDITLEFISTGPRGGETSIKVMDEVKSNMGSFYIGGSTEGVDILMRLLKSRGTTYEKRIGNDGKTKCFFHITNRELEEAVNYVIYHKYNAMERQKGKDFTTNIIFTSPHGDVRLLSDMLTQLQSDLMNGENSTIMKLIWERMESGKARVSLGYGFYNKK